MIHAWYTLSNATTGLSRKVWASVAKIRTLNFVAFRRGTSHTTVHEQSIWNNGGLLSTGYRMVS